jgi:hypothetical protein
LCEGMCGIVCMCVWLCTYVGCEGVKGWYVIDHMWGLWKGCVKDLKVWGVQIPWGLRATSSRMWGVDVGRGGVQ